MSQTHIMIDIETLGRGPTAAIVAISAVLWQQDIGQPCRDSTLGCTLDAIDIRVDATDSQRQGGTLDASTVLWWLGQEPDARGALLDQPRLLIADALDELSRFFPPQQTPWVWANSPSFDLAILRSAYERIGITPPWRYWQERDYRTLARIHASIAPPDRSGIAHTALDDARHQARHLSDILGALS